MAKTGIIWMGSRAESEAAPLVEALRGTFPGLEITVAPDLREGLAWLAADPEGWGIVLADLRRSQGVASSLTSRIKQINPDIETLILAPPGSSWRDIEINGNQGVMVLDDSAGPLSLVSAMAKLMEVAELRKGMGTLSGSMGRRVSISRRNVEAALALLYRLAGVGIVTVRRDGFLTFYDSEARRLTGSAPPERASLGDWIASLAAEPEQAAELLAAVDRFWELGAGRAELILTIDRPGGGRRDLSISALVLVDDQGDARQLVLLFYDPQDKNAALEYEGLLAAPGLGMYAYYPDQGFARITPKALELINQAFGLEMGPGDVLGRRLEELPLPPEPVEAWQEMLRRAARGERLEHTPPLGQPGRRLLSHAYLLPVQRELAGPAGVVAMTQAPSHQVGRAEAALVSGGLAWLTLQAMPQALIMLEAARGPDGGVEHFKVLGVNSAAWRLLGRVDFFRPYMSLEQLFGDEAALERILAEARLVTEQGGEVHLEMGVRLAGSAGGSRLISFWLGRVGDGAAVIMQDMTAQRDQEQRQRQYRHIFRHMEEAIIVTDLKGMIIDWNPAAERMFGYRKDEVLGQDTRILMPQYRSRELAQHGARVTREGDVWKSEYEFMRKDGRRGMSSTVLALLKDDEGKAYGTVGLTHDVTERRLLQENLATKSRELQEKNLALNTLLRAAEEERVRACEMVATDVARRITQRIHQLLDHADQPEMVSELAGLLLEDLGRGQASQKLDPADPALTLSEKELEVARLIRAGKTSEQIATLLGKSPDTIRLQRISIRKKLGLTRRDHNLANYLNRMDII